VRTHLTRSLPAAVAGLLLVAAAGGRAQDVLSAASKAAIEEALQDERRGEAIYSRVLEDHGRVRRSRTSCGRSGGTPICSRTY
jgi:hypothetical protein